MLATLALAVAAISGSTSNAIQCRPNILHTAGTVPPPQNGSHTTWPNHHRTAAVHRHANGRQPSHSDALCHVDTSCPTHSRCGTEPTADLARSNLWATSCRFAVGSLCRPTSRAFLERPRTLKMMKASTLSLLVILGGNGIIFQW